MIEGEPGGRRLSVADGGETGVADVDAEVERASRREICRRCLQPRLNCYCAALVPQESRTRWIFLQHPGEARNPVGTARMAHLSLPGSRLLVGVDFSRERQLLALIAASRRPAVLFPAEESRVLGEGDPDAAPDMLIVIDGTWSQARKIWKTNDFLRALPACRLPPTPPSRYRIRAEPAAHCVSTIEAVAAALQALDGQDHEAMLAPFLSLVSRQAGFGEAPERSPRRRLRTPRGLYLPKALQEDGASALLIHVEANGFPRSMRERPSGELVELRARRVGDGSSLSALCLPTCRGPRFEELGLTVEDEALAMSPAELIARWQDFQRPRDACPNGDRQRDVWVAWGTFALDLMARAGLSVRAARDVVDVKHWCSSLLGKNPGTLTHACDLLGVSAPPAHLIRRADRQLWRLEQVFARLSERARSAQR